LFLLAHATWLLATNGQGPQLGSLLASPAHADDSRIIQFSGNLTNLVTTTNDGQTLIVWMFGPEVSGVPRLEKVLKYDAP